MLKAGVFEVLGYVCQHRFAKRPGLLVRMQDDVLQALKYVILKEYLLVLR